jgi:hypothetical protein
MKISGYIARAALALACMPPVCHADVLEARSAANIAFSALGGSNMQVVSTPLLAAGQYRAVGKVSVGNSTGREDYTRCGIALDGVLLDSSFTAVGGLNAPSAATIFTEARVTTTTPNHSVSVLCSHDHSFAGIVAQAGASLEVSNSPAGPQGDQGIPGPPGLVGLPGAATFGICVGVNAQSPTSAYCSCPSGKQISNVTTAGTCTAVAQSGSCSAIGHVPMNGGAVYTAACCTCNS